MLSPGCRVDVISAFVDERTRQTVARAVIENAKVTNVGGRGKGTEGGALRTVTMIVTANEAMALELAAARGRPRIVLRGPGDDSRTTQPILTAADLVPAPPEPKVEAPATAPVTQPAPVPAPATRPEEPPRVIVVVEAPPPLPTPEEPPGHQIHVIRGSTESTVIVDKHPTTAPVVSPATRPGARPVVRRGN
jgi:Flp pilus assembly protein CpaB